MNIALVTGHTENYKELAKLTVPGKIEYAEKHNYKIFIQTENWIVYPKISIGYEKCFYIEKIMIDNPTIEWFWWSGTDCLITNHTIKLETLIDPNYHFIVCKDDHGINADVFFIRNSPEGREYIKHLQVENPLGSEQATMWQDEAVETWKKITKYIPQRYMNAYNLAYYPHKRKQDVFGERNNWQEGDFVLQAVTGYNPKFKGDDNYNWKIKQITEKINSVVK